MHSLTIEWLEKAEGDFATAGREVRARKNPNYDSACFHAQQVAEKYLKAILQENLHHIPRTHNLLNLLALCLPFEPTLMAFQDALARLDRYAVRFRYPGESADRNEARMVYKLAKQFREFARNLPTLNS